MARELARGHQYGTGSTSGCSTGIVARRLTSHRCESCSNQPSDFSDDRRQLTAEAEMPYVFNPRSEGLEHVSWSSNKEMVEKDGN